MGCENGEIVGLRYREAHHRFPFAGSAGRLMWISELVNQSQVGEKSFEFFFWNICLRTAFHPSYKDLIRWRQAVIPKAFLVKATTDLNGHYWLDIRGSWLLLQIKYAVVMLYDERWSIWVKALNGCFFIFNILLIYKKKKKTQPTAVDESRVVMVVIHSPINQLDGEQLLQ